MGGERGDAWVSRQRIVGIERPLYALLGQPVPHRVIADSVQARRLRHLIQQGTKIQNRLDMGDGLGHSEFIIVVGNPIHGFRWMGQRRRVPPADGAISVFSIKPRRAGQGNGNHRRLFKVRRERGQGAGRKAKDSTSKRIASSSRLRRLHPVKQSLHITDRDGISNPAGFFQDGLLALLNKHLVNHPNHPARVRLVQRAAAIARIGGCVELQHLERLILQAADRRRVQIARRRNGNSHGADSGNNALMGYGKQSQNHADWEAGESDRLALAWSTRFAQAQSGQRRTFDFQQGQVVFCIQRNFFRRMRFNPGSLADKHRQGFFVLWIKKSGQGMGVRDDVSTVADDKAGRFKLGRWPTGRLYRAHGDNTWFDFLHRVS